jgi:hypothetical protein
VSNVSRACGVRVELGALGVGGRARLGLFVDLVVGPLIGVDGAIGRELDRFRRACVVRLLDLGALGVGQDEIAGVDPLAGVRGPTDRVLLAGLGDQDAAASGGSLRLRDRDLAALGDDNENVRDLRHAEGLSLGDGGEGLRLDHAIAGTIGGELGDGFCHLGRSDVRADFLEELGHAAIAVDLAVDLHGVSLDP